MSLPRVGRLLLALAVTLGMLVLTPSPSWACSCAMADTAEHVRQATTVAAGTVQWTATDGQTTTYDVLFDAVYKGAAGSSEKLSTNANEAACGLAHLATDKRYLFFIEGRHPGAMRVGLCGGTVAYDDSVAREVAAVTGPPGEPLPTRTHEAPPSSGGLRGGLALSVGVGAAVLVAAAVVLSLRRQGSRR